MPTLTDTELDQAYTHLCRTMTRLGEASATLFLARFALLAMTRIGDAEAGAEADRQRCRRCRIGGASRSPETGMTSTDSKYLVGFAGGFAHLREGHQGAGVLRRESIRKQDPERAAGCL